MEDAAAKVNEYTQQLQQIEELLAADPSNTEYAKLKSDLEEVLRLTRSYLSLEAEAEPADAPPAAPAAAVGGGGGGDAGAEATGGQEARFPVGTVCEAVFQGGWYPGRVLGAPNGECQIRFLGYNNEETLPWQSVRPLSQVPSLSPAAVSVGLECEAFYPADSAWYAAIVEGVVEDGFLVKFTEYKNTEEIPLAYLRIVPGQPGEAEVEVEAPAVEQMAEAVAEQAAPPPQETVAPPPPPSSSASSAASAPAFAVGQQFVVPEHLKILPTDTEEQKTKKRKKAKALKYGHKKQEEEAVGNEKQHTWKSFQKKSVSKKLKGAKTMRKGQGSIFKSPDAVDGKVGVMASGRPLTQFEVRKKYKLNSGGSVAR